MEHLVKRQEFKVDYNGDKIYVLKYFLNNIMINLRFLKKIEDEFEEVFTEDVKKEDAENLMLLLNEDKNITPLNENELKYLDDKLNEYMDNAKNLIVEQIQAIDINRNVLNIGEVAGNVYMATKNRGDFFIELFNIHIKEKGTNPEIYLINQNFAEMALLDYKSKTIVSKDYIFAKINDIFYIGLMRSEFKQGSYFTVGVIEYLIDNLSCNKAYMIEIENGKYSPLNIKKFTPSMEKALKADVKKMCDTFLRKIIK